MKLASGSLSQGTKARGRGFGRFRTRDDGGAGATSSSELISMGLVASFAVGGLASWFAFLLALRVLFLGMTLGGEVSRARAAAVAAKFASSSAKYSSKFSSCVEVVSVGGEEEGNNDDEPLVPMAASGP